MSREPEPQDSVPDDGTVQLRWSEVPEDAVLPQDAVPADGTVRLGKAPAAMPGPVSAPAPGSEAATRFVPLAAEVPTVRLDPRLGTPPAFAPEAQTVRQHQSWPAAEPGSEDVTQFVPLAAEVPTARLEPTLVARLEPTLAAPLAHEAEAQPTAQPEPSVPVAPVPVATAAAPASAGEAAAAPDPGLIRFGPGVPDPKTARTIAVWRGQALPAAEEEQQKKARRRGWLWWIPVVVVALAVLGWYLWQSQSATPLAVQSASVSVVSATVGCDGTATVTATVGTDGDAGSFTYHWLRSDGTDSGLLTETVAAGTRQVQLPLLWKISGPGRFHGTATLVLPNDPALRPSASFDYSC